MLNALKSIFSTFAEFFYAPRCPVCGEYIEDRHQILCAKCDEAIMAVEQYPQQRPPLKEIWRLTKYTGGSREIIADLKFNDKLSVLSVTSKILEKALQCEQVQRLLKQVDVATFVPLHESRESERGFNQVELIFGEWLKGENIAMERLTVRTRATEHLYNKNLQERQAEVAGAFALLEGVEGKLEGKRVLILDDIFTTGTTMSECAKVLKRSGAAEVYALALASDFGRKATS